MVNFYLFEIGLILFICILLIFIINCTLRLSAHTSTVYKEQYNVQSLHGTFTCCDLASLRDKKASTHVQKYSGLCRAFSARTPRELNENLTRSWRKPAVDATRVIVVVVFFWLWLLPYSQVYLENNSH
jgi:hypothetical protein